MMQAQDLRRLLGRHRPSRHQPRRALWHKLDVQVDAALGWMSFVAGSTRSDALDR
jgi:hypothetical protein